LVPVVKAFWISELNAAVVALVWAVSGQYYAANLPGGLIKAKSLSEFERQVVAFQEALNAGVADFPWG